MCAPSNVISFMLTDLSSKKMVSHFLGLSTRPIYLAHFAIIFTSEATVTSRPERVKSSINQISTLAWEELLDCFAKIPVDLMSHPVGNHLWTRADVLQRKNWFAGASCVDEAIKFWNVQGCCIQNDIPPNLVERINEVKFYYDMIAWNLW